MSVTVRVPQLTDNDTELLVTEVAVAAGQFVDRGDLLAVVETSKAASELRAPEAGFVGPLGCQAGESYPVGHTFCLLLEQPDAVDPVDAPQAESPPPEAEPEAEPDRLSAPEVRVTARAMRLAEAFDIDPASLGRNPVRTDDLLPQVIAPEERHQFLDLIRHDPAFRALSSPLKVMMYRRAGFDVAPDAVLEEGALLLAPEISVGSDTRIGARTVIRCDTRLAIGHGTSIGHDGAFECVRLSIGNHVRIGEQVIMDVAGGGTAESGVVVEDRCLVSLGCYINACRRVHLQERSALSPRAMIFTHRYWQNVFDGYEAAFGNVTLEPDSWVGGGAQVMAGVTVGAGGQVMAGSVVVHSTPPATMVGGVPATVLRRDLRRPLKGAEREQLLDRLMDRFLIEREQTGCTVSREDRDGIRRAVITGGTGRRHVLVWPKEPESADDIHVVIGFDLEDGGRPAIDLARQSVLGPPHPLTDLLRDFLRRRGLDFRPYAWSFDRSTGL